MTTLEEIDLSEFQKHRRAAHVLLKQQKRVGRKTSVIVKKATPAVLLGFIAPAKQRGQAKARSLRDALAGRFLRYSA